MHSPGVTATSHSTSKPADLNVRRHNSMSSPQSSKKSTRRGLFWGSFSAAGQARILSSSVESRLRRRLVHHQPVIAEPFDGRAELVEINRLLNVAVDPQPVALHHVLFLFGGGQDH